MKFGVLIVTFIVICFSMFIEFNTNFELKKQFSYRFNYYTLELNNDHTQINIVYLDNKATFETPYKENLVFLGFNTLDGDLIIDADGNLIAGVGNYTDVNGNWVGHEEITVISLFDNKEVLEEVVYDEDVQEDEGFVITILFKVIMFIVIFVVSIIFIYFIMILKRKLKKL